MPAAPLPPNETARVEALKRCHILDTSPEPGFDDLTRQAKELCEVPIALISLVEGERQWFKSVFGLAVRQTPRSQSVCAHALLTPNQPLIVPDLTADPRFADNPLVTGEPKMRFYAGVPLRSPEGHGLGALCVIDLVPRQLSARQIEEFEALAQQVSIRLGLRRQPVAARRVAVGFGLGFALLLCMAIFFVSQFTRLLSSDRWVSHTNQVVQEIERTLYEVVSAESTQRAFSATGREHYLPAYESALAALPAHLMALHDEIADNPRQQQNYQELRTEIEDKVAIMRERIEQRRAYGAAALEPQYMDGRGHQAMERISRVGQAMIGIENALLQERAAARSAGLRNAVGLLAVMSVLGAVLLGSGFWMIRHELSHGHTLSGALAQANMGLGSEVAERRRAQRRLDVQRRVAHAAAEHLSLRQAAPEFLKIICEHLDWDLGERWVMNPIEGVLRLDDRWHRPADASPNAARVAEFSAVSQDWTFAKGEGLPGRAWKESADIWEHDLAASRCFLRTAPAARAGLSRAYAFPLPGMAADQCAGVMVFLSSERGVPDLELVATMETLAGQIAQFSARCEASAGLQASQARFSAFIENAPAVAYIKDDEGKMLYGNTTLLHRFNLHADEWLGKTDADFWPEAAPAIRAVDHRVLSGEIAVETNEAIPLPDGSLSHWLSYKFPLRDEATGRKLLAGISIDITRRQEAETALRQEREFLAALLNNLQAGVVACDAQGRLTHCNPAAAEFHGFPADQPVPPFARWGEYFEMLPASGGEPLREDNGPLALALHGSATRDLEFFIRPKCGRERALNLNAVPLEDSEGKLLGAVGVIYDVTAQRQARENALHSLYEKETLLQEVHHRVKNNLQIIGSLLSMQARRAKSPAVLAALGESASRVRSIALVHEKLYRSPDLECVEAADYLRTLSRNLMEALGGERLRLKGRVVLDFELEEGHQLDASVAIACGLIVNEALTNSFKHGFPDERNGRVIVALKGLSGESSVRVNGSAEQSGNPRRVSSRLRLEVRDDGIGLPAAALTPGGTAELTRHSLGMRLVRDLSKQVAGDFEFSAADSATGTGLALRVDFTVNQARAAA